VHCEQDGTTFIGMQYYRSDCCGCYNFMPPQLQAHRALQAALQVARNLPNAKHLVPIGHLRFGGDLVMASIFKVDVLGSISGPTPVTCGG
jgi:hypothetical protein